MKFKVVGESFKKYAPKDPERMDNHMGDETPEDIYNELKKRSVRFIINRKRIPPPLQVEDEFCKFSR